MKNLIFIVLVSIVLTGCSVSKINQYTTPTDFTQATYEYKESLFNM